MALEAVVVVRDALVGGIQGGASPDGGLDSMCNDIVTSRLFSRGTRVRGHLSRNHLHHFLDLCVPWAYIQPALSVAVLAPLTLFGARGRPLRNPGQAPEGI